jgi:hypothetical protein
MAGVGAGADAADAAAKLLAMTALGPATSSWITAA